MSSLEEAFLAARIFRPYYARALAALRPVERPGLGTMAVDKNWNLYFDPKHIEKLTSAVAGVCIGGHEVEHLLRNHCSRGENFGDAWKWNVAGDMEINDELKKEEFPVSHVRPEHFLCPDGLTAEEYYEKITVGKSREKLCGGGSGAGNPLEWETDCKEEADKNISEERGEKIREQVARDVKTFSEKNGRGTVPAGILVWADSKIEESKIPWQRVLRGKIKMNARAFSRGRADFSYTKLSRRFSPNFIRPGAVSPQPKISILADTSGSMENEGGKVLGEIKNICRKFGDVEIFSCDTEARKVGRRKKFLGGGGTDLRAGLEKIPRETTFAVVITDGETPWPENSPGYPVFVMVLGNSKTEIPGWAIQVENS